MELRLANGVLLSDESAGGYTGTLAGTVAPEDALTLKTADNSYTRGADNDPFVGKLLLIDDADPTLGTILTQGRRMWVKTTAALTRGRTFLQVNGAGLAKSAATGTPVTVIAVANFGGQDAAYVEF